MLLDDGVRSRIDLEDGFARETAGPDPAIGEGDCTSTPGDAYTRLDLSRLGVDADEFLGGPDPYPGTACANSDAGGPHPYLDVEENRPVSQGRP